MNVYDFDGTIYKDDSTVDFYLYLLRKKPKVVSCLPKFLMYFLKYKSAKVNKTQMKEIFYRHLTLLDEQELDAYVIDFWKLYKYKIYDWYMKNKLPTDVIISASPRYILSHICEELKVEKLICSEVDKRSGTYTGLNCHGAEKVNRFYKEYPDGVIDRFYSDSDSDLPLARLAKEAYKVKRGGKVVKWDIKHESK